MTEKRVTVDFDTESYYLDGEYWESWDNYGEEMADAINKLLNEESNKREQENEQLKSENDSYKNMFFEIVENALTDKNCRELYCKGILDIFDKANSLNQARDMIKRHLND